MSKNLRFLNKRQYTVPILKCYSLPSNTISPNFRKYSTDKYELYILMNEITSGKHITKMIPDMVGNMPLQATIYFNIVLFPFWVSTIIQLLIVKYSSLHSLYKILITVILVILIPVECFRLYLGYFANLSNKIPELSGFWMLSLLIQLPLQTFLLMSDGMNPQPVECVMQLIMCTMLIVQLITGLGALKNVSKNHTMQFYILQLYKR